MLPSTLTTTIVNLLSLWAPYDPHSAPAAGLASVHAGPQTLSFELRHVHAVSSAARVVLADVPTAQIQSRGYGEASYEVQTRAVKSFRPPSFEAYSEARMRFIGRDQSHALGWEEDEIIGPNVESRETLLVLAKMTNNAYVEPEDDAWYDLGGNWTVSYPIGWEPENDGFRGHVFATPDNSTIVISIKGTSAGFLGGGGPTQKNDKRNDNLLFSCCCASVRATLNNFDASTLILCTARLDLAGHRCVAVIEAAGNAIRTVWAKLLSRIVSFILSGQSVNAS
ncbi:hypothetical protein HWV62_2276 [Athelia sp. TMB]|nr:hypothetical protein HWV62_2276 [Athelia sp. TMB]